MFYSLKRTIYIDQILIIHKREIESLMGRNFPVCTEVLPNVAVSWTCKKETTNNYSTLA